MPKVLISVLNWNNATDTIKCIHSLQTLDYKNFTIVVVDNASIDNSAETIRKEFPDLTMLLSDENLGYAGGNKLTWEWGREKGFDLFWIINNDAKVKTDCLSKFVASYLNLGNVILGGVTLETDEETISFAGGMEFDENRVIDYSRANIFFGKKISEVQGILKLREVGYVNGANMVIPAKVIKEFGYIDTGFFMYSEELDYCFSLRKNYKVQSYLVPDAIVIHNSSASFKKNQKLKNIGVYYNTRNWCFFQLKHQGKTKTEIIKSDIGIANFIKNYLNSLIRKNEDYLLDTELAKTLALVHAMTGKKGKVFEPNNFL